MHKSFLAKKLIFGLSNALLILMAVFFVLPILGRGAKQSFEHTNNNIKDWLPADFRETKELQWFGHYFAGERFIVATWPGCNENDQRLQILVEKLRAESEGNVPADAPPDLERARAVGRELELLAPSDYRTNKGRRNEKWLSSASGQKYDIDAKRQRPRRHG